MAALKGIGEPNQEHGQHTGRYISTCSHVTVGRSGRLADTVSGLLECFVEALQTSPHASCAPDFSAFAKLSLFSDRSAMARSRGGKLCDSLDFVCSLVLILGVSLGGCLHQLRWFYCIARRFKHSDLDFHDASHL